MTERTHAMRCTRTAWCTEHVTETDACTALIESPIQGLSMWIAANGNERPTITLDLYRGPVRLAPADVIALGATLASLGEAYTARRSAA